MAGKPDPAIPQQMSITKDSDPIKFLNKASKILQFDLQRMRNSPRVKKSDRATHDILLYLLWQEGKYTNKQIGKLFNLTYSAVSRRVRAIRKRMESEENFFKQVIAIESQIKP